MGGTGEWKRYLAENIVKELRCTGIIAQQSSDDSDQPKTMEDQCFTNGSELRLTLVEVQI